MGEKNRREARSLGINEKRYYAYVGTYTGGGSEGIYIYRYDAEVGKLQEAGLPAKIDNPSFISLSNDNKYLYSVIETSTFNGENGGGTAAFKIDQNTGYLTFLNAQPTKGDSPCYISVDKYNKYLVTANYGEGTVTLYPVREDGSIAQPSYIAVHDGSGPNKERQEKAHAHYVDFTPDQRYICSVDLGIDQVKVYKLEMVNGCLKMAKERSLNIAPGSGPRHLAFHPDRDFAYVVTELSSQIAALRYDPWDSRFDVLQYVSALPDGYEGISYSSAIHISPDGRFLYVSNRGHDSIAVFKIDKPTGKLSLVSFCPTGGRWPRDFAIDPLGKFLFAANQYSNSIVSFKIDQETGILEPANMVMEVPSPVCIKFAVLGE